RLALRPQFVPVPRKLADNGYIPSGSERNRRLRADKKVRSHSSAGGSETGCGLLLERIANRSCALRHRTRFGSLYSSGWLPRPLEWSSRVESVLSGVKCLRCYAECAEFGPITAPTQHDRTDRPRGQGPKPAIQRIVGGALMTYWLKG